MAFATPVFLSRSTYGAYFLFGGFSLFSVVVLAITMPETKGHSLESIQEGFQALLTSRPRLKGRNFLTGPCLTMPDHANV